MAGVRAEDEAGHVDDETTCKIEGSENSLSHGDHDGDGQYADAYAKPKCDLCGLVAAA